MLIRRVALALSLVLTSFAVAASDCYPIERTDLYEEHAPRFEQYPITEIYHGKLANLDTRSHKFARRFKTMLTLGKDKGANFAGDMSIVGWGCGSGCVEWAAVNVRSGKVYTANRMSFIGNTDIADIPEFNSPDDAYWGLKFRKDSRLLILLGAMGDDKTREGVTYLLWEKDHFKLLGHKYVQKRWCELDK